MARDVNLKPEYSSSHALIIGINQYAHLSQLHYAVNDARGVGEILKATFGFPAPNVTFMANHEATKAQILSALMRHEKQMDRDSRLLMFFAGHGHTKTASQGEVGFLVPQDGCLED